MLCYISGYKENFINPSEGLSLIEAIYNRFHCDILLTTRAAFDKNNINRLFYLFELMRQNGNEIFLQLNTSI